MFKIINKYVIGIIIVYILWLVILPIVLSKTLVVVCDNISHNSGYEIKLEHPQFRFSVLPTTKFISDKIVLKSKNKDLSLNIESFSVKIRLFPLLKGRLHINEIKSKNMELSANLRTNLQLDKDFFYNIENGNIVCDSVKINNFNISLYQQNIKKPITYKGKNFIYKNKNRYVKLYVDSTLNIFDKNSKIFVNTYLPKNNDVRYTIFEVDVANIDISSFKEYFAHFLPQDLIELKGIVNIKAKKESLVTELKNCAVIMKNEPKSIIFPDKMIINSDFNIKRNYIKLNNVDINSKNIHMSLNGKISEYFGRTMPSLDLNIRLDNSRFEDLTNIMPAIITEDFNCYKLKQYKYYGNALGNISIKGRLPEPDITGEIYVNDGILIKPIPNSKGGAIVKLQFIGKYLNYDVHVPAGGNEKVSVIGSVELYNIKYSDMQVRTSDNVDLHVAEDVVNPLHEILNFVTGPVPIMDIKGKGSLNIDVKGNRNNPHIWGQMIIKNANVKFNDMPDLLLENADALLTFKDQQAFFKTTSGIVNGKEFKVNGVCSLLGKFDFDVITYNQPVMKMYKSLETSTLIPEIKNLIPKIDYADGLMDLSLKIYGNLKCIEDLKFNENTFVKGDINLKNDTIKAFDMTVDKVLGKVSFASNSATADITAQIAGYSAVLKAKLKNNIAEINLNIPKFNPNFMLQKEQNLPKQFLPLVSVDAKYNGKIDKIEYDKINLIAKVLGTPDKSDIKYNNGLIIVQNGNIIIKNLKGYIQNPQNIFEVNLKTKDAFSQKYNSNGNVKLSFPDVQLLNNIFICQFLPKEIKHYLKDYEFHKGKLNLDCKIVDNKAYANTDLSGLNFVYIPLDMPVSVINGNLAIRGNILKFNKINVLMDKMPMLLDGEIKDIFKTRNFNLYINSKPKQEFIDKYINTKNIYPIKVKGDIVYWAKLKGVCNNFDLKANVNMAKDSSFYHYGATVGDIENAISIDLDTNVLSGNNLRIKEFSYDKLIKSQNGRQTKLNLVKTQGGLIFYPDDIDFKDLKIKTTNPTDARIFNIIFRKPNIKQGQFTSDLKINGKLSNPRVLGDFHIFETNIPFFDTTMKNIELIFKDRVVEISSKGDVMGNNVTLTGVMKNKLTVPYQLDKANIYTKKLDLNNVANKIKAVQVENVADYDTFNAVNLNTLIFNNVKLKADNIVLRNIDATNVDATVSLNDKGILDINNFKFEIANGYVNGKYKYNLRNNDMKLDMNATNISANDITIALFDLNNQIYGDLTGNINISCNGLDFESCMESLTGETKFNVINGRMPKLGSLEYLLKAGNLVKGGITGVSINGVIDLITPLKTGEFSEIVGNIRMKDGIARSIDIATSGKDLSLYLTGTYNFATSVAKMDVYGILARKISTMFGNVGNVSINTLFNVIPGVDLSKNSDVLDKINKIPGIELSSKSFRKFIAEIRGNIEGENYVTSFQWIN